MGKTDRFAKRIGTAFPDGTKAIKSMLCNFSANPDLPNEDGEEKDPIELPPTTEDPP